MPQFDPLALQRYRERLFRQTPSLRLRSIQEAGEFIGRMGLCLFQPNQGVELPSLWGAAAGRSGPAPRWGQHDDLYEQVWGWKDRLFASGEFYYGKALGNYRLFITRDLLPYLWALSEMNYGGEADDYLELYQDGKLSLDAKLVYGVLREHGPSSTTVLRRATGMVGEGSAWARFERALNELQRGLMIAAVGIARDNAWKYTFRYATLPDAFPREVEQARAIPTRRALAHVLAHYVWLQGAATPRAAARLFGWSDERTLRAAGELVASGVVVADAVAADAPLFAREAVEELARGA